MLRFIYAEQGIDVADRYKSNIFNSALVIALVFFTPKYSLKCI